MLVQAENLSKHFGNKAAVQNLSFRIDPGQIYGVLGPRAAGKTTVMRILAGYIPPSAGEVTVAGFNVATHSLDVRKRVGYLPAGRALYSDMTVEGYLDFVAKLRHVSDRAQRVADVLEQLSLSLFASHTIGKLPAGVGRRFGNAETRRPGGFFFLRAHCH